MALQYVAYDDSNIEPGKFYYVQINKDLAPNLLETSFVNGKIDANADNISALLLDMTKLKTDETNLETIVYDNQARINNLEDRDLTKEFLLGLNLNSIRVYLNNTTELKIKYGRKEITNIIVYQKLMDTPLKKEYKEVTSGININYIEDYNEDGALIEKYVIIKTDKPITGYALLL